VGDNPNQVPRRAKDNEINYGFDPDEKKLADDLRNKKTPDPVKEFKEKPFGHSARLKKTKDGCSSTFIFPICSEAKGSLLKARLTYKCTDTGEERELPLLDLTFDTPNAKDFPLTPPEKDPKKEEVAPKK